MIFVSNPSPRPVVPYTDGRIDWLKLKQNSPGDWYVTQGWYSLDDEYRIYNLWPFYATMKTLGYSYYAMCAIASICWYASGLDGGAWGSGAAISSVEVPGWEYHPATGQIPEYWTGYYKTIPTNNYTDENNFLCGHEWPVWSMPSGMSWASGGPSHGIIQWTPYSTALKDPVTLAGDETGEDWSKFWAQNTSLQLLMLDWQRRHSGEPKTQWVNDWFSPADIANNYRCVNTTWDVFYKDGTFDLEFALPETYDLISTDIGKFDLQCYTWLGHYINAGSRQLDNDLDNRHSVYNLYIKDAFTAWDNNGGAGLLDVPLPYGTYLDMIHLGLWAILKGRKRKGVRTVLL